MAQLDDDIPAEPVPAPPYEGDGSDIDGRLRLSLAQEVEFMGSLHPREVSILQMGKIRGVDFDEIRNACVALHFGEDRIAVPYLLSGYECFRELYVAPLTTGQGLLMRELQIPRLLQGGPLLISGVISPVNGLINGQLKL